ncbi:MAG: hypothetical protein RLZZ272_691 [Actinomycetota bacterium]
MSVRRIGWSECHEWVVEADRVRHRTGRYFQVGLLANAREERLMVWQAEVGLLGFVVTRDGRWLVQRKREPGNVGGAEVGPTVQATRSNLDRVHGGRPTRHLDVLIAGPPDVDVLGSEQGDRFVDKHNRDLIRVIEDVAVVGEPSPNHAWMTTEGLRAALLEDHRVNSDARSVLACGRWDLLARDGSAFAEDPTGAGQHAAWRASYLERDPERTAAAERLLDAVQERRDPSTFAHAVPLSAARAHRLDAHGIVDARGRRVLGCFDVELPEREVPTWQQPLLERQEETEALLLHTVIGGVLHVNVRAWPELGWTSRVEFGPSWQSGPGKEDVARPDPTLVEPGAAVRQGDEGGRFWRNLCTYRLGRWLGDPDALSEDAVWVTLGELEMLARRTDRVTNELRSAISVLIASC